MRLPYHRTIIVVGFLIFAWCMSALDCGAQTVGSGPYSAIIAGNVLDAVSTEIALQRPGLREANPILGQSQTRRLAIKSVGTVAQVWIVKAVGKTRPKLAKGLGYGVGAFFGGVAIWNSSR